MRGRKTTKKGERVAPEVLEQAKSLKDRLIEASPLKHAVAKEQLALTVEALSITRDRLKRLSEAGNIGTEQERNVAAIANQIKKCLEALALIDAPDPDEAEGFDD